MGLGSYRRVLSLVQNMQTLGQLFEPLYLFDLSIPPPLLTSNLHSSLTTTRSSSDAPLPLPILLLPIIFTNLLPVLLLMPVLPLIPILPPNSNLNPVASMAAPVPMLLCGTPNAPKFDGKTPSELPHYLKDIELLGDPANLDDTRKIKAAI